VHPGYGFLSEQGDFARACAAAGVVFVGPSPAVLDLFGDKVQARALAVAVGVPVVPGSAGASLAEVEAFVSTHGLPVLLKACRGAPRRALACFTLLTTLILGRTRGPSRRRWPRHAGGASAQRAARGVRPVRVGGVRGHCPTEADRCGRCVSEAVVAFGDGAVFVEAYVEHARHVEVQVLADAVGHVLVLGDRDCSVQVRRERPACHYPPFLG
jgi:pyruvate carboxylase